MNSEEKNFIESLSYEDKAILDAILEEGEETNASEGAVVKRMNLTTESILDKKINKCVMLIAKAKNDPMYAKFVKFFKLSRVWRKKLRQKYYGQARGIVMSAGGLHATDVAAEVNKRFKK